MVAIRQAKRGTLGSRSLDAEVAAALPALFPPRESRGALTRDFDYRDGERPGTATVYIELHGPPARMVIVGAGHIAIPLSRLGEMLGLRVEVLDDRPDFANRERFPGASAVRIVDFRDPFEDTPLAPHDHVVLVTRGHSFDYECLVRLLRMGSPPHYVGMIGSRRRVRATHEQLLRDGFTPEEMGRVRAPVGLDLGGQTPVEIAVAVAAEIIIAAQTALTRRINVFEPGVITFARIRAGTTHNVIPETAQLLGTVRALSETTRGELHAILHRVATNVAAAHGVEAEVEFGVGYPVTVNDPRYTAFVRSVARQALGDDYVGEPPWPSMGGEDFSYVLNDVPGTMAYLGSCPPGHEPGQVPGNHSNRVVYDEDAMITGVALHAAVAMAHGDGGFDS